MMLGGRLDQSIDPAAIASLPAPQLVDWDPAKESNRMVHTCMSYIYRIKPALALAAFEDDEYEDLEDSDQDKEEEDEEEGEEGWEDDDEEYEEYYHGPRAGRQPQGCPTQ